ncbi:MAG: NUDIX domain-containing protein [Rickettsiales bacterium]|jgi:ADP-ribose pyrophosphatase/8-oxo-dGTP diphosphatase|nr:NUDIX domain-containing protein [Rickettsiales bacterium]
MLEKPKVTRAGMGIMVTDSDGRVLMGLRNSDAAMASSDLNGEGTWTFPGGKFDFGDGLFEGVARELKEETDLDLIKAEIISISNECNEKAHYITLGFLAKQWSGEVKTMEPDEIVCWNWFSLDALPKNVYAPTMKLIENYKAHRLTSDL